MKSDRYWVTMFVVALLWLTTVGVGFMLDTYVARAAEPGGIVLYKVTLYSGGKPVRVFSATSITTPSHDNWVELQTPTFGRVRLHGTYVIETNPRPNDD